jgi:hypothetical protein
MLKSFILDYFINLSNNLKLIIEGWKPSLSKIKNINEKHSLALHIHEQSQKTKRIKKILQK